MRQFREFRLSFSSQSCDRQPRSRQTRTEGPAYGLPIAVRLLPAFEQRVGNAPDNLLVRELSLDAGARHVRGIPPIGGMALEQGIQSLYVPGDDAREGSLVESTIWL